MPRINVPRHGLPLLLIVFIIADFIYRNSTVSTSCDVAAIIAIVFSFSTLFPHVLISIVIPRVLCVRMSDFSLVAYYIFEHTINLWWLFFVAFALVLVAVWFGCMLLRNANQNRMNLMHKINFRSIYLCDNFIFVLSVYVTLEMVPFILYLPFIWRLNSSSLFVFGRIKWYRKYAFD